MNKKELAHLTRDLILVGFSILLAIILVRVGALQNILTKTQELRIIGSFVSGIFFTSVLTIAPATVALAKIAEAGSPVSVAFWASLGAMLGDMIIFLFVRDVFANDIVSAFNRSKLKRAAANLNLGFVRWFMPLFGALIIASPLPDELGLAMMGLSKMKASYAIPLAFIANFLGILALVLIAGSI